ncbi:E3 ubiquitin-protein ligase rnf213-alpha-like [Mercenaria mercenaria]|uniref:E3 ubiquitin-protein ligase rnf213-alpha-like n=1 Tax=Mercenaria mercenaria TaxID=6596 RepID=UPI00234E8E56|nr:E3 ubiquitin-protein ligase rnf213-alpha-like [Mercenaria mercenaria]
MFTLENEYYIRFILLLVKGGTEVLRKVVIKGLQKRNVKLETFLEENRSTICNSNLISKIQRDILYPPSPDSTDISKWDISLLSFIILEFLKSYFTAGDISSVVKLRDMQDMVSAHQADAAIDGREFTTIWSDLSVTITVLCHAMELNDNEKDFLMKLVSSIASADLDMNEAVKELKMLKDTGEFLKGIQTSLTNLEYLESAKQSQSALETSVSALNEDDSGHLTEKMDRVQLTDTDESKDVIDDDATCTAVKDSNTSNSDTDTESTKMGDEKEIAESAVPELSEIKGKKKKRKKNKRKHKKDTDAKRQKLQTEIDKDEEIVNKHGQYVREDGFELSQTTSNADKSLNPKQHAGMVFGTGKSTKTQHSENPPEMRATHQCSLFEGDIKNDKSLETKNDDDKNRSSKNQEKQAQKGVHSEAETLDKLNNDAQYTASQATKSDKDGTDVDGGYKTKRETRSKTKTPAERPNSKPRGKDPKRTPDESKRTSDRISIDTEEMIKVQFHVLISPDFNFDNNMDKVVIRLKYSDDRQPYRHQMDFVRELTSGYIEMTYILDVPQNQVTGDSKLCYKYFVLDKNSPQKQGKKNGLWEHYFVKGRSGPLFDRNLHVPRDKVDSKTSTIWHQFDGIANRKSDKGIFVNLINDHVLRNLKLQDDANLAMQVFGEQVIQPVLSAGLSASAAILNVGEMTESLIHGLWKTYVNDGQCFKSKDEMKKELGKYLFDPVLSVFTRLPERQTQETDKQWKRRLIVQLTLLTIWKEMKLDISMSTSQQLCKSFLIANSSDKKTCKEFEFIKQTFPTKIEFFKEALVTLGKLTTEQSKDPSWLYTMPLIHFLSGACNQLNKNTRHDDTLPKWWGTMHRVQDTIAKFKAHQHKRWEIPLLEVIQTLQPLFVVDFLLPRTIMACLNVSEVFDAISTGMIPVEICCATLVYFLKTKGSSGWFGGDGEGDVISKCMQTLVEQLTQGDNGSSDRELSKSWFLPTKISLDLVQQALKIKRYDIARNSIRVFLICASNYVRLKEHRPADQYTRQEVMKDVENLCQKTLRWLKDNYCHWYGNLTESIMVWNECMVSGDLILQELEEFWNMSLSHDLARNLTAFIHYKRDNAEKIIKLYCKTFDSYKPYMQNCLHETAIKAIDGAYNIDVGYFDQYERGRYGTLLSTMFHANWSKIMQNVSDVSDRNFLKQILEWQPFLRFMKILVVQKQSYLLDDECEGNLMVTLAIVQSLVESLLKGSLRIGDLQIMHEYAETFADIASRVKMDDEGTEITKEMILTGIKIRKKELDMFLSRAEMIVSLAFLCTPLSRVQISTFDEVLIKQATIENHTLNEFCQPVKIDCVEKIDDDYLPELIVFRLPASIDAILQKMHLCRKSSVFLKMWKTQCEKCDGDCTSLVDVSKVWKPVYERLEKVLREIESGKILFCQFEELLGSNCGEDYEQIVNELRILQIKQDIIETRVEQLKKYRYLETCKSGAQSLLRLKSECNLEGDFEQIELIADDARENIEMEQFDDSLMDACEFLKDFSRSRAACLNTFLNCQPLVQWLKESMHTSGLKELQVFVDLASMSIGDNPYNIGKVQALHSAVTGYAPLIFDLREECGFKELLDLCKLVWRELKANPKLPKQLEDTNSQIEWLTEIKNAHGVVEVTSMMQTEAINTNGTFIIGRQALQDKEESNTLHDYLMSVADTVKLIVPGELGKRKKRNYTFSELQDLQSRLMLVAGKADTGTESVERFTMIFDSITRLGKVFVKLHTSGCVLFKDWSARFICDPDPARPVCATITFGQGDEVQQLKGRRTVNEDLKDMIPKIARFMELCHETWLQHINDKRWTHTHLNYFTVDQLVILQRELVKFGTDDKPSHLIYPLLSAVKKGCTEDDIQQAILSAKNVIGWEDEMETDDDKEMDTPGLEKNEDIVEDERKMTFIRNLVDAGQEEAVAIKALAHVDDLDDFNQGILWCIEHGDSDMSDEDDMSEGENTTIKSDLQRSFEGWSKSEVSMQSIINANLSCLGQHSNIGVEPLIHDLQQLWNRFLTSISSNIRDYLSIEHLGIILQQLAFSDLEMIDRSLPPGIKESIPNLLVCPKDDVLVTALSVYMMDKGQPLPQSDEILMCTSRTTVQEVDIFWRRALFGGGKKIHCLLHADYLEYEVSEVSERLLKDYLLEIRHKADVSYRLCVICGQENEYRSTMVSFLDKYRTQAPPVNKEKLKVDIADRLAVHNSDYAFKPAAFVDSDRSTVRIIKSWRAGVGKTLFKRKKSKELLSLNDDSVSTDIVTIPLQEKHVDIHYVIERLLNHTSMPGDQAVKLFHIDISHEVQEGIDYLLFNLLILGCLVDKTGYVWRKLDTDLYLIETMPIMTPIAEKQELGYHCIHPMLAFLPDITCRSPQESLEIYKGEMLQDHQKTDQLFDENEFLSEKYQRPFQYLLRLTKKTSLENVHPDRPEGNQRTCLEILLRYCGIQDPSWSELHHFVWFLNTQLVDFKENDFVSGAAADVLPGFSTFVLRFLIQMSKDFSTRSLYISEESPGLTQCQNEVMETDDEETDDIIKLYQMRRTWESSPHPYLFFNWDRLTFTFLGFNIQKASGNLIDQQTGNVLEESIMQSNLYEALERNHVPLQEHFNLIPREEKIKKLRGVMGKPSSEDPDDTYELTTDNAKKILAIYMRFRCDIPVIIMGETGCGKTRLVKFLCGLQIPKGEDITNMVLMKVHGGTTSKDIIQKVRKAEALAKSNMEKYGKHMYTVLFFDEANSTQAIGLIKEIMCDKSMEGEKLQICVNLKIVAACNPYRKHSEELIKKLEQAGLGYHVDADETIDRLGRVPMRRLVYRVQPLPQSLLPLVWDFGQLNTQVEDLYIQQMVKRHIVAEELPDITGLKEAISAILTASQDYMRQQKDECSFVSLRDVERVLTVMSWFYKQSQNERLLYNLMDEKLNIQVDTDEESDTDDDVIEEETDVQTPHRVDDITRSLILALGVCYHACLKTREQYRDYIASYFQQPCKLPGGSQQIFNEIDCCQDVFLDQVDLAKNIARNMALKENVFMMVVCIELRIPLFLIGKPGSSKSLAKTIVSDAMRGNAAKRELFRGMKQAQMASFQCSPLSTPDGIVGTFKQCARFQRDKNLDTFVSVVVLDEVGLAEDSPRMPLKTLHPLLEDGCHGEEKPDEYEEVLNADTEDEEHEQYQMALHPRPEDGLLQEDKPKKYKKVAFIGISNWALDPAKMNRGIVVQREVPDIEELINSARGICSTDEEILSQMEHLIQPMAVSYLELFNTASEKTREFFGLRDFYRYSNQL